MPLGVCSATEMWIFTNDRADRAARCVSDRPNCNDPAYPMLLSRVAHFRLGLSRVLVRINWQALTIPSWSKVGSH